MIDGPSLTDVITSGKVRVPPAPTSALRLRALWDVQETSPDRLARVVSLDPPLCAAVLRAANGGRWKDLEPVSSVQEAIERLPPETLPELALTLPAAGAATHDGPLAQLRVLAWRRSLTSAMICQFVAQHRCGPAADAFACGLLHDFGWIVALSALEDLLEAQPDESQRSAESWLALVDQFHILLGHITATRWGLPPLIAEVILSHHLPEKADPLYRPMVELVALSDSIVALLEQQPAVTEAHLSQLPGMEWNLPARLAPALPQIAADTSSLLELFPGATLPLAVPSKVARTTSVLRGRPKSVHWNVSWMNNQSVVPGVITTVTPDGLAALLPLAPRENFLLKLAVDTPDNTLEVFATALAVEDSDGQHRVQARLFALAGEPKRSWDRLYANAAAG